MENQLEKLTIAGSLLGAALAIGGVVLYNHSKRKDNSDDPLDEYYSQLAPNPKIIKVYSTI